MTMCFYLEEIIVTVLPRSFSVQRIFTGGKVDKKSYPLTSKKLQKVLQEIQEDFSFSSLPILIIVNHESDKFYYQSFADFENYMKTII